MGGYSTERCESETGEGVQILEYQNFTRWKDYVQNYIWLLFENIKPIKIYLFFTNFYVKKKLQTSIIILKLELGKLFTFLTSFWLYMVLNYREEGKEGYRSFWDMVLEENAEYFIEA